MRIRSTDLEAEYSLVFLNERLVKNYIEADSDEGWVDIIDIKAMAPPFENVVNEPGKEEEDLLVWEEIPVKRKHGNVKIYLPKQKNLPST